MRTLILVVLVLVLVLVLFGCGGVTSPTESTPPSDGCPAGQHMAGGTCVANATHGTLTSAWVEIPIAEVPNPGWDVRPPSFNTSLGNGRLSSFPAKKEEISDGARVTAIRLSLVSPATGLDMNPQGPCRSLVAEWGGLYDGEDKTSNLRGRGIRANGVEITTIDPFTGSALFRLAGNDGTVVTGCRE